MLFGDTQLPGLPGIAGGAEESHAVSNYPIATVCLGASPADRSGGCAPFGDDLLFYASGNYWRWAMYRFPAVSELGEPQNLTISLSEIGEAPYYIGIPDYAAGHWRFVKDDGMSAVSSFPLDSSTVLSPAGSVYGLVLCGPRVKMAVAQLSLDINCLIPPPLAVEASQGTMLDAIQLKWTPLETSYPQPGALNYDSIRVLRALSKDGTYTEVGTAPPGSSMWLDDGSALAISPLQDYYYKLCLAKGSTLGPASTIVTGYGGVLPVAKMVILPKGFSGVCDVFFDASLSSSADPRAVLTYDWDLDNDGIYETPGVIVMGSFDMSIENEVGLRVSVSESLYATTTGTVPGSDCPLIWDDLSQSDPVDNVTFIGGAGPSYTWRISLKFFIGCGQAPFTVTCDPDYDGVFGPAFLQVGTYQLSGGISGSISVTSKPGEYYIAVRGQDYDVPGGVGTYVWRDKIQLEVPAE